MSKHDTDFLTAQTRRLEAAGIVLRSGKGEYFACLPWLHPHRRRGRKRVYQSAAKRQRAYRYRSKSRTVTK